MPLIILPLIPLPLPPSTLSSHFNQSQGSIMEILLLLFIIQLPDDFTVHLVLELVWALHLRLLLSLLWHQQKYYNNN